MKHKMNQIASRPALEGFMCPTCMVNLSSSKQLQGHWLHFHCEKTTEQEPGFRLARPSHPSSHDGEIPKDTRNLERKVGPCVFGYNFDRICVFSSYLFIPIQAMLSGRFLAGKGLTIMVT